MLPKTILWVLTMDSLPILLLLSIKDGVFILGYHFLLNRHLRLPPLRSLRSEALLSQGSIKNCDYIVHRA